MNITKNEQEDFVAAQELAANAENFVREAFKEYRGNTKKVLKEINRRFSNDLVSKQEATWCVSHVKRS